MVVAADRSLNRAKPWHVAVIVAVMLVIAILDVLYPGVGFVVLLVLPLVVSAVLAGPRVTAGVGLLACALAFYVGWVDGDLAEPDAWLHVLMLALAAALATWFSAWLQRWRTAARGQDDRFRLLAENAMDLVVSTTPEGFVEWISPSALPLLGWPPDALVGQDATSLFHADDRVTVRQTARSARETDELPDCRVRMLRKDAEPLWVDATPRGIYDDTGVLVGGVIGVRDVAKEVAVQEALTREVDFDALTGLAKRDLALSRVQSVLDSRHADGWALLCVGVDGMTAINQAYSFSAGDAVLVSVTERLVRAAGAHDRVSRIAGDEFIVLLLDVVTPTDAAAAAQRLLDAVRGPVSVAGEVIDVTCCVGVAMATGQNAVDLVRDASAAMWQAAARSNDCWQFLDGNVGDAFRQELTVQSALRDALAAGHIKAWFMPVARLDTGRIVGWEALARWVHTDGTVTEPEGFIAVAERSGLISAVDQGILRQTVRALVDLPDEQHVAVNMSAVTLSDPALPDVVRSTLDEFGVAANRLHVEVTETTLLHVTDHVRKAIADIAAQGVRWWVDDFGTGFSSISHLRDLPIIGLKLDRAFTNEVSLKDTQSTRLAEGLAGLARGLDLETIAEGVDTLEQARILEAQGWKMGQGWLYGKAVPVPGQPLP